MRGAGPHINKLSADDHYCRVLQFNQYVTLSNSRNASDTSESILNNFRVHFCLLLDTTEILLLVVLVFSPASGLLSWDVDILASKSESRAAKCLKKMNNPSYSGD